MSVFLRALLLFALLVPLFAQEAEIERMQSVVDEVTVLRMRYEACLQKKEAYEQQIEAQNEVIQKLTSDKDTKSTPCEAKVPQKKCVESKELLALKKENTRLSLALAEAEENLRNFKKECDQKPANARCADENPFPKLLMKEEKLLSPPIKKEAAEAVRHEKAINYRLKHASEIYDTPKGKVIFLWEEKRSFTSNVSQGEWIKITGYFVQRKWQRATEEMWVKEKDAFKR